VLSPLIGQEGLLAAKPVNRILELLQGHIRKAISGDTGLPRICVHVRSGTTFTGWPIDGCSVDSRWILMRLESPDRIQTNLLYLDSNEILAVEVQAAENCLPLLSEGVLKGPPVAIPTVLDLKRRAEELAIEISKTLAAPCELTFLDLDKASSDDQRLALDQVLNQFRSALAFILASAIGKAAVKSSIAKFLISATSHNAIELQNRELSVTWNARDSTSAKMKDAIEALL
jgi:hypothetical protein